MVEEELQNSVSISPSPRQPQDVTCRTWVPQSPGGSFPFPSSSAICQNSVSCSPLTAEGDGDDPCWPQKQHGGRWAQPSSMIQAAWVPMEGGTGFPNSPEGALDHGDRTRGQQDTDLPVGFSTLGSKKQPIPVRSGLPRWLSGKINK